MPAKVVDAEVAKWNVRGVRLGSSTEALAFGALVIRSNMAPKGMTRPEQIVLALQRGAELGLSPMASLSSIPVINGRTTIMGDAAKSLILQSGKLREGMGINERVEGDPGDPESWVAFCTSWRSDNTSELVSTFSVAEAKLAGLWKKQGPWSQYPKRMLRYRALGFHVRDHYPDVILPGIYTTEEAMDMPLAVDVTPRQEPTGDDPLFASEAAEEAAQLESPAAREPLGSETIDADFTEAT